MPQAFGSLDATFAGLQLKSRGSSLVAVGGDEPIGADADFGQIGLWTVFTS